MKLDKNNRTTIYENMIPRMTQYDRLCEIKIHCRCGITIRTSSIEYFCGNCGFKLIDPCSHAGTAHKAYDFTHCFGGEI